jgi:hypothetical protein
MLGWLGCPFEFEDVSNGSLISHAHLCFSILLSGFWRLVNIHSNSRMYFTVLWFYNLIWGAISTKIQECLYKILDCSMLASLRCACDFEDVLHGSLMFYLHIYIAASSIKDVFTKCMNCVCWRCLNIHEHSRMYLAHAWLLDVDRIRISNQIWECT